MRSRSFSVTGAARAALTALTVLAVFGLGSPKASAQIALVWNATEGSNTGTGNGTNSLTVNSQTVGDFSVSLTVTTANVQVPIASSGLTSTTTTINNNTGSTETITLTVTGSGYNLGGLATNGEVLSTSNSVSGTAGGAGSNVYTPGTDTATLSGSVNGSQVGSNSVGTLSPPNVQTAGTATYSFTNNPSAGQSGSTTLSSSTFSISQTLVITLGAYDSSSFTITTGAKAPTPVNGAVPEPSSMVLASLGGLGLIGVGLRRRKASGA